MFGEKYLFFQKYHLNALSNLCWHDLYFGDFSL